MSARANVDVDGRPWRDGIVRADLSHRSNCLADEIKFADCRLVLTRERNRNWPWRNRQKLAPLGDNWQRQSLPQCLGDEWHNWMQQPQRVVEGMSEHCPRSLRIVPA